MSSDLEPRPLPEQQVPPAVPQRPSISFLSAIPIKKRKFLLIRPPSPEENVPELDNNGEPQISDEGRTYKNNQETLNDSKTPALVEWKGEVTPRNIESGQANVETIESEPQEVKPTVSLNPVSNFENKSANVETIASGHPEVKPTVSLNPVSNFENKSANVETIAAGHPEVKPTVSLNSVSDFENKSANVETIAPGHPEVKPTVSLNSVSDFEDKSVNVETIAAGHPEVKPTVSLNPVSDFENKAAHVEAIASGPEEEKPTVSLNSVSDFGNKMDNIQLEEKTSLEPEVLESCAATQTSIVKQEIACGPELSTGPMIVELSLGLREQLVVPSSLESKKSEPVRFTLEKSDPSQMSLPLSKEKTVGLGNSNCTTVGDVSTNRSNWDLNTTMEDWEEGSSKSDSLFARIGGFVKTDSCHEEKSSLTTAENVDLGLNKGKKIISGADKSVHIGPQCKIDDSLGLRLGTPHRGHVSLSGSFVSTSATPNLGFQRLHMSSLNKNRAVKMEPIGMSSRGDCSVGSCSSNNSNRILETVLKSPIFPNKLVNHSMLIKSEVHQESCASSSSSSACSLTMPLVPPNYLELSIHSKDIQLRPCKIDNKHKSTRVDEAVADDDEKRNVLAEVNEELFESDCGFQGNRSVDKLLGIGEPIRGKEDADLEEGEVWEPVQHPTIEEGPIDKGNKSDHLLFSSCGFENSMGSSDQDFDMKYSIKENHDKSNSEKDSVSITCNNENNNKSIPLQKVLDTVLEVGVDDNIFASVTPDNRHHLSVRENIEETPVKETSRDRPTNVGSGISRVDVEVAATTDDNKVVQEIYSGENVSTWPASFSGHDDANEFGNKSRIINLSRASFETSPCKTRSFPNRSMIQRSGKESYFDLGGEIQPRGNREENYGGNGSSNKFTKYRVNDQSLRNSRPNFIHGRGRMSGRFGTLPNNEWDSDHDFASEASYGTPNYRTLRRKHAPDMEIECNGYDQQDFNNKRRKATNDEFRRASIRRLSPRDNNNNNKGGPPIRGNNQTFRRFTKNRSPSDDKFTRHLSDDIMNPIYNHPQAMYDEFDGQLERGNMNFSNRQRKGYPRIRSKSPVRSPRRRSPNGLQDFPQHRSSGFYKTGRMKSPDRRSFHEEMVSRRRGSPYVARHSNNEIRDVGTGREHCHPRLLDNSSSRGNPSRVFQRNARRTDTLDSREMEDGDEYMNNEPLQSNKFHDERRKFSERRGRGRGRGRSFRPSYNNGNGESFRFHMNDDDSRPYRFCPDTGSDFVERGDDSVRETECDGRIKHQPMGLSKRNRNEEDQQDEEFKPVERVWHDDGFGDGRGKRRRF